MDRIRPLPPLSYGIADAVLDELKGKLTTSSTVAEPPRMTAAEVLEKSRLLVRELDAAMTPAHRLVVGSLAALKKAMEDQAPFLIPDPTASGPNTYCGLPIEEDKGLPPDVAELRGERGTVLRRIVGVGKKAP